MQKNVKKIYPNILEDANIYVKEKYDLINTRYKNIYHLNAPVGWLNDPNGLCYAFGKYHAFFQFNPYGPHWNKMHWGHYVSNDLVKWEWQGVVLAPDCEFDKDGCFSGSALFIEDTLYLMYTGISDNRQLQNIAISKDGINFEKKGVVINGDCLPNDINKYEFRDPRLIYRNNKYYALIGTKNKSSGLIVLYESKDMYNWSYINTIWEAKNHNGVCECPDIYFQDDQSILIYGVPNNNPNDLYKNKALNIYVSGKMDFEKGIFNGKHTAEIDQGSDFYASQIFRGKNNNILLAWMGMWNKYYPTAIDGWQGSFTFPRMIFLDNNKLIQEPIDSIKNYYISEITKENIIIEDELKIEGVNGKLFDLFVDFNLQNATSIGLEILKGEDVSVLLNYDVKGGVFSIDSRSAMKHNNNVSIDTYYRESNVTLLNNSLKLRVLVDKSTVELFINDGQVVMSMLVYLSSKDSNINFFSKGGIGKIKNLKFNKLNDEE